MQYCQSFALLAVVLAWAPCAAAEKAVNPRGAGAQAADLTRLSAIGGSTVSLEADSAKPLPVRKSNPNAERSAAAVEPVSGGGVVAGAANDLCAGATAISGGGPFSFNSSVNSLDGPTACMVEGESQIDRDEWFCWTAPMTPCAGEYVVSTCGTLVDTKIAVYDGCDCGDTNFIACSDDDCGLQTHLPFTATPGASYLVRIGVFPGAVGGPGSFTITCRPPLPCQQPGANCQSPTVLDALQSTRGGFVVADDFTPASSGDITNVCWWGAYQDSTGADCHGVAPDSFVVKYYSSVNGAPGAELATFAQSDASLVLQGASQTGLFIQAAAEYEFSATHAALPVTAGECYWIEISNGIPGCTWFWEVGLNRNERAFQDGRTGRPDGYQPDEAILDDLAFCTSTPLANSVACLPPPPPNDACADAAAVNSAGELFFEVAGGTLDGPPHAACISAGQSQIAHDAWYCFTAPCTDEVFVRTCENTQVDTRLAVYQGCTCPVTDGRLLECSDDICGEDNGLQSMAVFDAAQGQQYLIRVGTFPNAPGGPGFLNITCGPPNHPGCPGTDSCCQGAATAGCSDENCCESVCACDPFCCEVAWDDSCAANGFADSGCGAAQLCSCSAACGDPDAGDCCTGHGTPSCSDETCCTTVCACDPYCCETEWDEACATTGFENNGCGAGEMCPGCIPNCPVGPVSFSNPASGIVDARQPHPPGNSALAEGLSAFMVQAPTGAEAGCWKVHESAVAGTPNFIADVVENAGTYTITLGRPITPGAVTNICYRNNDGASTVGQFIFHPGNVNALGLAEAADVDALRLALGGSALPHGLVSGDADRSGRLGPLDLLTELDLLNGASAFSIWGNTAKPTAAATCP